MIWNRQKSDTARSYAALRIYLELGPQRSLDKVREKCGRKPSYVRQIEKWSARHQWVERARAYDMEFEDLEWAKTLEQRDRVRRKLIGHAEELVDEALQVAVGKKNAGATQVVMLRDLLTRVGLSHPRVTTTRTVTRTDADGSTATDITEVADVADLDSNELLQQYREYLRPPSGDDAGRSGRGDR